MVEHFISKVETKISQFIEIIEGLKRENQELKGELKRKDVEIEELKRKAEDLSEEKETVKKSIEKLLGKLELIEL
jgi:FtsZ-binding cell division protein ZapB